MIVPIFDGWHLSFDCAGKILALPIALATTEVCAGSDERVGYGYSLFVLFFRICLFRFEDET